jgi:hypothetical protein
MPPYRSAYLLKKSPIHFTFTSGNRKWFFWQKRHVQMAIKPRSPWSETRPLPNICYLIPQVLGTTCKLLLSRRTSHYMKYYCSFSVKGCFQLDGSGEKWTDLKDRNLRERSRDFIWQLIPSVFITSLPFLVWCETKGASGAVCAIGNWVPNCKLLYEMALNL